MSKASSAKFCQDNKEKLKEKLVKDITVFWKNKKEKNEKKCGCEQHKNLSEDEKK